MKKSHSHALPTPEQMKSLLIARLKLAEELIMDDIKSGHVLAEEAVSFKALHDTTDPNCYVSDEGEPASTMEKDLLSGFSTQDWINYWQILTDAVDSWLKRGRRESLTEHLQDEKIVNGF